MTEALKPCPFCGKAPFEKLWGDREDETGEVEDGFYEVACKTCTGGSTERFCGVHASSREKAITAWNARSEARPQQDTGGEAEPVTDPYKLRAGLVQDLWDAAMDGWAGDAVAIDPETAADIAMAHFAAPPLPVGSAAREQIARIIDPDEYVWEAFADDEAKIVKARIEHRRSEALTKADAILALASPLILGGGEGNQGVSAYNCAASSPESGEGTLPSPTKDEVLAQRDEAQREAVELATTLHRRFYSEITQWKPLEYPAGVISQIDNMVAGIIAMGSRREAALQPFAARIVDVGEDEADEDTFSNSRTPYSRSPVITVGDIRHASAVLSPPEGAK